MRFVILFLLGISQYALGQDSGTSSIGTSDGDTTPVFNGGAICSDGLASGRRTTTECARFCAREGLDARQETVVTLADVKAAIAARDADTLTDDDIRRDLIEKARSVCLSDNPLVGITHCQFDELRVKDKTTCDGAFLTCNQQSRCTAFATTKRYFCYMGACRQKIATCSADAHGNTIAAYSFSDTDEADDLSLCAELCGDSDTNRTDTCTEDYMDESTGCYTPCVQDDVDSRLVAGTTQAVTDVIAHSDALTKYKEWCASRNTLLSSCKDGNIVPRADALGCGCGECVEDECVVENRFVYYADGDTKKCKKIHCERNLVTKTASYDKDDVALAGLVTTETYRNYIRSYTETDVDVLYCTGDADDETTPAPDTDDSIDCDNACARYALIDVDPRVCVKDTVGGIVKTFECAEAFKCAVRDAEVAGNADRYKWHSYGRCVDDNDVDNGCDLGDVKVSDKRYDRKGTGCPKICKCIENPDNTDTDTFANIWICDRMERQFDTLKSRCAAKLGADACTYNRLSYAACPRHTDDDICSQFTCSTGDDITDDDLTADSICRRSNTGFTTTIAAHTDAVGCKRTVCDRTTGESKTIRYDAAITASNADVVDYMYDVCPKLASCRGTTHFDSMDVCGVCPSCGADTRSDEQKRLDNVWGRGDAAVIEDALADKTRTDERNEAVKARCRARVPIRCPADDLFDFDVDQVYAAVNSGMLAVIRDHCTDIDEDDLTDVRCAVSALDWDRVDKLESEDKDIIYRMILDLDITDTDETRIRAIKTCLDGRDDLRADLIAEVTDRTKHSRLNDDGTVAVGLPLMHDDSTSDSVGAYKATTTLYEADGTTLLTTTDTTDSTTPSPTDGDTVPTGEGGVSTYSIIFALIASFVAMIF